MIINKKIMTAPFVTCSMRKGIAKRINKDLKAIMEAKKKKRKTRKKRKIRKIRKISQMKIHQMQIQPIQEQLLKAI